ncbi:aminodeoxychorismate synthase, component I [Amycolatopsis coloradensis]|uniref:Aminodeoxychorismate synthase, component I n=1 Tax=Amycolatopsis coloradensis TaxID=76021 RepID=A0A1R0KWW4_9PSEU|nr:aminodeoxychorismate synthase component I [Amycolatopsis coloradensis]OLZ53463.1 aminodeoxychorismate synthase, component I [Amycolatopsis coloradensis]
MRLMCRKLRTDVAPERALTTLGVHARSLGLAPPAALSGDWFSSRAVIALNAALAPVHDVAEAFAIPTRMPPIRDAVPGAVGGGWFGYLSYDLTDPSGRSGGLPPAVWGWVDRILRLDADGSWWFEALVPDDDPDPVGEVSAVDSLLAELPAMTTWSSGPLSRPLPSEHYDAVKACVHAIEAGELFQANICARFSGGFDGDPIALFAEGVRRLQARRAAYVAGDWGSIVSFSPELFLARHGQRVRSTPIKGTLPRRNASDGHLAQRLRESTKDVAENVMITDLVRNDLGRVCATGSVRVPELLEVRPAPGVWHLESTVEGRIADGVGDADLLAATFPPGSVTGAPKIRALDLIAELEPAARGVYTGAIGLASPIAGLELNVAIRTFEIHDGTISLGVGGGITADSDSEAEWQECLHKSAPLERLLG